MATAVPKTYVIDKYGYVACSLRVWYLVFAERNCEMELCLQNAKGRPLAALVGLLDRTN